MLRIVTDGACDMPSEWGKEYDIHVIPINIHIGDKTYLQGVDLSNDDFYDTVEKNKIIPKTSQPSPTQFEDFYSRVAQTGDTILSIHVTSKLSGTFASAEMAARELEGQFRVLPFDSAAGSVAQAYMCKEARLMDRAGSTIDEILRRLKFIRDNVNIILTLDTLEYARMSGRVKTLQAALASILNVKPIVVLTDGILDMADKVRTRHRALDTVVEKVYAKVGNRQVNAAVVHARDPESGKKLMERVSKALNYKELVMTELSIAVSANLGPGTVGVIAYPLAAE